MPGLERDEPKAENQGELGTPRGQEMPGQLSRSDAVRPVSTAGEAPQPQDHSMHQSASSRVLRTVRGPDVFVHKALSKRGCFVGSILHAQHLAAMHGPGPGVGLPPELRQHGPHAARLRMWPLSQIRLVRYSPSHAWVVQALTDPETPWPLV